MGKSRIWWLLGAFLGVAVLVVGGLVVYNRQYRLTDDKLKEAEARWAAAGVRDYDLDVVVSGRTAGHYHLKVRDKDRIVDARFNGEPNRAAVAMDVAGMFDILRQDLDREQQSPNQQSYTWVDFDPNDGHLIRYVRRSGDQHISVDVTLKLIRDHVSQ
jgi:hypothetical protein